MVKHLYSKLAITIYILLALGMGFWAYTIYKDRDGKVPTPAPSSVSTDSAPTISGTDDITNDSDTDNGPNAGSPTDPTSPSTLNPPVNDSTSAPTDSNKVSPVPIIKGSKLANITPQHCADNCQAFAIDLSLKEYCEQACGISPIKNETNCDGKTGIQKDYCLKDLAITKKDLSLCSKVNDANIKLACQSRIEQDAIENLGAGGNGTSQPDPAL